MRLLHPTGVHGEELWASDSIPGGTVMMRDIRAGGADSNMQGLIGMGGVLYFRADDGSHGTELWKSDGTFTSTVMVVDIYSGTTGSSPDELTWVDRGLFFQTDDGNLGEELWVLIVWPDAMNRVYLPLVYRDW